jgi:hypothetical protein
MEDRGPVLARPSVWHPCFTADPDIEAKVMSAIPHASGLPTPSPSRSGAGIKKGVFPPKPKSVRVWAVLDPETQPSQPEPVPNTPGKQLGQADCIATGTKPFTATYLVTTWVSLGVLGVLLAFVLAALLGKYLGK